MSLKHAILGFLSLRPLSGYDLKKTFDQSVQHFWPANQSQIYRTLAEMERQQFVSVQVVEREDRLDLKRYHITDAGKAELQRWLATPLAPQDNREPFLIQIYFGGKLSDAEMLNLIHTEMTAAGQRHALFSALLAASQARLEAYPDQRAAFFSLLTLEYGIRAQEAMLAWLKSVSERIQSGDYSTVTL